MEEENTVTAQPQLCGASQIVPIKLLLDRIPTVDEIERQYVNGCTSNTTETDICNELNQLQIMKKKKTRRKPRYKKALADYVLNNVEDPILNLFDDSSLLDVTFDFKITAISSRKNAKVFRIKNGGCCKHINLKYFGNLEGNGNAFIGTSNKFLPCTSKVTASDVLFYEEDYKSTVKIKNGSTHRLPFVSYPDNSNLQSLSSNPQSASASSSPKHRHRLKRQQRKFPPHMVLDEVLQGLERGELFKGVLRINAKNFREAYVSNGDRSEQDYVIQSILDRNRALEGDVVAIKLKDKSEWTEKQKTAFVVHILQQVHSRTAVGFLHLMPDKNKQYAQFIPRDFRVPKIKIPATVCPPSFHLHPNRYENMLFRAKITMWRDIKHPIGTIIDNIGVLGDLESETAAILAEHSLDVTPFPPDLLRYVPMVDVIPEKEFAYREDLRKECIFTIDPLTARDLDDAVSCKELENGNLEIGVHISDVSYYLTEGTPLDRMVCEKATTIYLVNSVYHMLPKEVCLYCSLLPGTDKLAFSVFWEMTKGGEIIRHRFARTVINSCAQLAYEHAQSMIENPNHEFQDDELPQIHGGFSYKNIRKIVNYLQAIAVNLRAQRFERGALRIDQTKLLFKLDENSGEPSQFFVYENKESHRLIEEFMLLANISVAQKIVEDFPDLAFLRCHEPPNPRMLSDLAKSLKLFNIDIDMSSSKAIQSSMCKVRDIQDLGILEMSVLNHLLAKPMTRARYFCASSVESEEDFQHYALHVPIYTHFTSPIRRYADIMVHRLLAASLGYVEKPSWASQYVMDVANNCNRQKYSAKLAGEASSDLYLAHYIADHQPFIHPAVVVDVKNSSFDILVIATGSIIRMFPNAFGNDIQCEQEQNDSRRRFLVVFPETSELPEQCYLIQLFCIVKVSLHRRSKTNRLEAKLLRPINSQLFERNN